MNYSQHEKDWLISRYKSVLMAGIQTSSCTVTHSICYAHFISQHTLISELYSLFYVKELSLQQPSSPFQPSVLCKPSAMCLYGPEPIVMPFYRPLIFQGCNSHLIAFDIPQVLSQQIPIIHYFFQMPVNISVQKSTRHIFTVAM